MGGLLIHDLFSQCQVGLMGYRHVGFTRVVWGPCWVSHKRSSEKIEVLRARWSAVVTKGEGSKSFFPVTRSRNDADLSEIRTGTVGSHAWGDRHKTCEAYGFHAQVAAPGTSLSDPGNPHLIPHAFCLDNPTGELYSEYWWLGGGRVHVFENKAH